MSGLDLNLKNGHGGGCWFEEVPSALTAPPQGRPGVGLVTVISKPQSLRNVSFDPEGHP